jgi:hypothetical protein
MEFVITPRKVEKGVFASFRNADRPADQLPVAQIFVPFAPTEPAETKHFSFFWRGHAERDQVHILLDRLSRPQSGVKARLIGQTYVSNFDFSPTTSCSDRTRVDWHLEFTHRLIDAANLPTSLGLALDTPDDDVHPSSVYVWASIDAGERSGPVQGNPELGVRTNLRDWQKAVLREAVLPLFESTVGLEKKDALDLFSRVAATAEELMAEQLKS